MTRNYDSECKTKTNGTAAYGKNCKNEAAKDSCGKNSRAVSQNEGLHTATSEGNHSSRC